MTATDATVGEPDTLCPDCGYDLRGMPADSGRCPECGLAIDLKAPAVSGVPWAHRPRMGLVRAYVKTAVLVVLRPRAFVGEVARAAHPENGRLFRWITLPFVLAPLAFLALVQSPFDASVVESAARAVAFGLASSFDPWAAPWMYGTQPEAVRVACVAAGLYAISGTAGWTLRRMDLTRERQERAASLAQYTCAPLLAVPLIFLAGCGLALAPQTFFIVSAYLLCSAVLLVLAVVEWWWTQVLLVQRATRSAGRAAAAAGLLPLAWAVIAAVVLFVIPWLIGWVRILIASF